MNPQLHSTSGLGVRSHHRSIGTFEVRHGSNSTNFNILEEAYAFFQQLNEEATLWDLTDVAELLESKAVY